MSEPPLIGLLIGAGFFARHHAEAWQRIPNARIAAVADPLPGRAESFAQEFGIPRAYVSVEEMLDEQQATFVDIVTRPETHLELTRLAATRGLHVICQKPMAPTMPECRAMVEACDAAGIRLLIHENWRWQPWYREIRRLLNNGLIGVPAAFSFHWRTQDGRGPEPYPAQPYFRQMPRLLVYETLVHLLDTFRFLHGELSSIYCVNRRLNPVIAGEDQSLISLTFRDGVPGLIDGNRLSGPANPGVAMGDMSIDGDAGRLRLSCDGHLWLQHAADTASCLPFQSPQTGYKGDSVFATQSHLINSLIHHAPSESEGIDYLKTTTAVFACYESAQTGNVITLE